jgi:hypothetical protein
MSNMQLKHGEYGSPLAATAADYPDNVEAVVQADADVNMKLTHGRCGSALHHLSDASPKPVSWRWGGANLQLVPQSASHLALGGQVGLTFRHYSIQFFQ